jgi:hypothetical protein
MDKNQLTIFEDSIKNKIYTIRGLQVMLDSDLAKFYDVPTKALNRAVKRNKDRFPQKFMFQLSEKEHDSLRSRFVTLENENSAFQNRASSDNSLRYQTGTLKKGRGEHRKYLPYAFTEQGVAMLSGVLRSSTAVRISIQIINAFVTMRRFITSNSQLFQRMDKTEQKLLEHDTKFEQVFNLIEDRGVKPEKGIFFNGQMFDAYTFVADLIRNAQKLIVLIDNFVDDSILTLFSKRDKDVDVVIFTKEITKQLTLDLKKYNSQYPRIDIKEFTQAHDRFLIIDDNEVYHIGASLKDLGKKWFAFSKFENKAFILLDKIREEIEKKNTG